jgi:hypothetical protein
VKPEPWLLIAVTLCLFASLAIVIFGAHFEAGLAFGKHAAWLGMVALAFGVALALVPTVLVAVWVL